MLIAKEIEWVTPEKIVTDEIVNLFITKGTLIQAYIGDTTPPIERLIVMALKIDKDILWLGEARSNEAYQEYLIEKKIRVLELAPGVGAGKSSHLNG